MIDWQAFDWPSFATLTTGALAVAGAVYVGIKQAAISARQTSILDRQVELEEAKLRADLFDRRFAVYQKIQDYLADILISGKNDFGPRVKEFATVIPSTRFLFSNTVHDSVSDAHMKASMFMARRANSFDQFEVDERTMQLEEELFTFFNNLPLLFGEYLHLESGYDLEPTFGSVEKI